MTGELLAALRHLGLLVGHLDTRDPRPHETLGKLDVRNVWLAVKHAWELHRLLRARGAAAVYVPISQSSLGYLRDALLMAVVHVHRRQLYLHLHGADFRQFYNSSSLLMRSLIRVTLRSACQLWILSPRLAPTFDGLMPHERLRTLQNVVPDHQAAPAADRNYDGASNAVRILYLGNQYSGKNCFDLLDALRALGVRASSWEVRIAGTCLPPIKRRFDAEIAHLRDVGIRIETVGLVDAAQKRRELEWADIFVYPTRFDGQPLVLLEALASGLPIVSTRHGAIPDTVRHGLEGLLVEPGGTGDLAEALALLAADPALRRKLGTRARGRYEQCYRPSRLVKDLAQLLQG